MNIHQCNELIVTVAQVQLYNVLILIVQCVLKQNLFRGVKRFNADYIYLKF